MYLTTAGLGAKAALRTAARLDPNETVHRLLKIACCVRCVRRRSVHSGTKPCDFSLQTFSSDELVVQIALQTFESHFALPLML